MTTCDFTYIEILMIFWRKWVQEPIMTFEQFRKVVRRYRLSLSAVPPKSTLIGYYVQKEAKIKVISCPQWVLTPAVHFRNVSCLFTFLESAVCL